MDARQYRAYVSSRDWRLRREELIVSLGAKCANCSIPRFLTNLHNWDGEDLHVDHLRYGNLGSETSDDVQLLCKRCHQAKSFRDDRRKEHLAHCYGRLAKRPEEWAVIMWMTLIARGRSTPWKDWRVAELEFQRASEDLDLAEIDTCFAECVRQSIYGVAMLAAFRKAAGTLKWERQNSKRRFFQPQQRRMR